MNEPIVVGAVAYSPNVVPIWDAMRDYFRSAGPEIDYVLFSNYDRQVRALLTGHVDVAWNTNLAWAKVYHRTNGTCRALAMRDVDAAFTTVLAARADSGVRAPADLRGRRVALGSADSAQAAILPLHYLQQAGLEPRRDCALVRFDLDVGKHGDTGSSELEVLRALGEGRADAGFLGESTWQAQLAKGAVDREQVRAVWTSPGYCHCNFTALADFPEELGRRWTESLLAMRYEDPCWRPLMELEGLRRWLAADAKTLEGYRVLLEAAERQGLARRWLAGE
jgi:ABC-type phosphate/phosphonate transport system substrate-binding protein